MEKLEKSSFLAVSTRSYFLGFWDSKETRGTVSTIQGNLSVEQSRQQACISSWKQKPWTKAYGGRSKHSKDKLIVLKTTPTT